MRPFTRRTRSHIGQPPAPSGVDHTIGEPDGVIVYPDLATIQQCHYFAAPLGTGDTDGKASNDGGYWTPWDLQTALSKVSELNGKTLGIQYGTYWGRFRSTLVNATVRGLRTLDFAFGGPAATTSKAGGIPKIDGYATTTLTSAINTSVTAIPVADNSLFKKAYDASAIDTMIVDGEAMQINSFTGSTIINVGRCAAGTSPPAAPVPTTHANGATVRMAGSHLGLYGTGTIYRDIEIMNSDPRRNWQTDGEEGIRGAGIFNTSDTNTFINCVTHDCLNGIFTGSSSSNSELYGHVSFNNGMNDPLSDPPGKGHGLYLENASGFLKVLNCFSTNNFNNGAQLYGRSAQSSGGIVDGCVFANSGSVLNNGNIQNRNFIAGPESVRMPAATVQNNIFFHPHNKTAYNVFFGYGGGIDVVYALNNIIVGGTVGVAVDDVTTVNLTGSQIYTANPQGKNVETLARAYTWNYNTYYFTPPSGDSAYKFTNATTSENEMFSVWKPHTGFDASSTIISGVMPPMVKVQPNAYEAGQALITILNQTGTTATFDLQAAGAIPGHYYILRQAFYKNDTTKNVASGIYTGGSQIVTIPLNSANATAVPTPVGESYTPPTTLPAFGAFILLDGGVAP